MSLQKKVLLLAYCNQLICSDQPQCSVIGVCTLAQCCIWSYMLYQRQCTVHCADASSPLHRFCISRQGEVLWGSKTHVRVFYRGKRSFIFAQRLRLLMFFIYIMYFGVNMHAHTLIFDSDEFLHYYAQEKLMLPCHRRRQEEMVDWTDSLWETESV